MRNLILCVISLCFICCRTSEKISPYKIEIYDNSLNSIVNIEAKIEVLADSISLPEGPVWDEKNSCLLFVDILKNKVLKWDEKTGVSDYITPAGNTGYAPNLEGGILGANGLAINSEGTLILCQHGDRRLAAVEKIEGVTATFETVSYTHLTLPTILLV